MNNDEVIPPSPTVKIKKPKVRNKNTTTPRQKKRPRSLMSLRAKKMKSNDNSLLKSSVPNENETNGESVISPDGTINIYAGLEEASSEEKNYTVSVLKNFDVLSQSKLLENCNQYELAHSQRVSNTQALAQSTCGLISLKELLATQSSNLLDSSASAHESRILSCAQNLDQQGINLSSNFEFSEWPGVDCNAISKAPSNEQNNVSLGIHDQQILQNNFGETSHVSSFSSPKSIVQNILSDFDETFTEESPTRSPPVLLFRRKVRKTYERTHNAPVKTLLFDDEDQQNAAAGDDFEISATQYTQDNAEIDIDLNTSRRILENLSQLNTFFTQPQTYVLDFNADLTHTIEDFDGQFNTISSNSGDFECAIFHDEPSAIEPINENETEDGELGVKKSQEKNDSISELLELEESLLINVDTPKAELQSKYAKQSMEISNVHSTPSTSKQAMLTEQRVSKRLRFELDVEQNDCDVNSSTDAPPLVKRGFATARGKLFQTSAESLKRTTAGIFGNIDAEFKEIEPIINENPNSKKVKLIDANEAIPSFSRATVGFNSSRAKMSETIIKDARNVSDEDFSDLRAKASSSGFKTCSTNFKTSNMDFKAGSANFNNGFSTAGGSSIRINKTNYLQKYAQTFKDLTKTLCAEFGVEQEPNLNEDAMVCKTPLNKMKSKVFTTSTPNPSSLNALKMCPPVTPINNENWDKEEDMDEWIQTLDGQGKDYLMISTQSIQTDPHSRNASVNFNISTASDFPLNDSVAGLNVLEICEEIKLGRENALIIQQADCFKKRHPIRPQPGRLSLEKLYSDALKLCDLGTPKKYQRDELERLGVQTNVIDLNIDDVLKFKFDMWQFYPLEVCQTNIEGIDMKDEMKLILDGNSRVGLKEITSAFLQCPAVDPKLIPDHWINNCFKFILLKLASYERSFPHEFAGKRLTPENVLLQLKYRYDREIDKVQRSAIRKIVERDDTAAKRMILMVNRIIQNNLAVSLELCDGWYAIRTCSLDTVLANAVTKGKIAIGTKLVIQGAELVGIEEACSPLEMPTSIALKISGNSTRRVKWHAKLGYCREAWPFPVTLNSINGNGGLIVRMKAFVLRVYPLVYIVKQQSDSGPKTVVRSFKKEQREGKKNDKKHFDMVEKFYGEASEMVEKEYQSARKKYRRRKLCDIDDGEELWNYLEDSNDGVSFETDLTLTQKRILNDYQTKFNDTKQSKIEEIFKKKMDAFGNKATSTPLQKLRLIDASTPCASKTVILSIWNADESYSTLRENKFLDIKYVTANGMRGKDVQIVAGNSTQMREIHSLKPLPAHDAFARKITFIAEIDPAQFKPAFNEFDTLGFVLKVEDPIPNHYQSVFIVDAKANIFCIRFWDCIQHYAYEDIVQVNKFLVITQLEWRAQNRLNRNYIPQAYANELTTFSESPRSVERASALQILKDEFDCLNLDEYLEVCRQKIDDGQANKENSSINHSSRASESNLSKTIDTSLNESKPNEPSLNQSMLIRTTPGSSKSAHPKGAQERIDKLRRYASPPPFRSSYLASTRTPDISRKPFKDPRKQ